MTRIKLLTGLLALVAAFVAAGVAMAADSVPDRPPRDKKAPELHIAVTPDVLTNPNGRLRAIEVSGEAEDDNEIEDLYLASVESDELGGANDIAGERIGSFDTDLFLRAERAGNGNGRVYRLTYVAVDSAGNRAADTATVTVPVE
jgi:endo-1,4-beta-xylanase